VMIYHRRSCVGYMLWVRYALARGKPRTTLTEIYSRYLESPGTKAYSRNEAGTLFDEFHEVEMRVQLTHADLLASSVGQRHRGLLLNIGRRLWPRWLIKAVLPGHGLFLLIRGRKPVT
jgi:hypothetical protein